MDLMNGGVPRGDDYFGREDLIEMLWTRLAKDNVVLLAPRRYGKTGAMFYLEDFPRNDFRPVYIDLEPIPSAGEFVVELLATLLRDHRFARIATALWDTTKGIGKFLRDLPSRVELGDLKVHLREQTDVHADWRNYGDRVMNLLAQEEPRLLLMLDEFPMMVSNFAERDMDELRLFLRWFRKARVVPDTKTRFLLAGSINLVHTLDGMGLVDTINDLSEIPIGPFDMPTARRFMEAAMATNGVEISEDVREHILEVLGTPIPYLLALLLRMLIDRHKKTKAPTTVAEVDEVFQTELLGGAGTFFFHYYSRLTQYYPGEEARQAKGILGQLSRSETSVQAQTLYQIFLKRSGQPSTIETEERFRRLMQKLENDFYVVATDGRYEFSNRTIRLWWRNYYGAVLA